MCFLCNGFILTVHTYYSRIEKDFTESLASDLQIIWLTVFCKVLVKVLSNIYIYDNITLSLL